MVQAEHNVKMYPCQHCGKMFHESEGRFNVPEEKAYFSCVECDKEQIELYGI